MANQENGAGAAGDVEPEQFRKMFIGGLTSSTTEENLKEYYSQYGKILDCIVMRDPTTKRSRGFGFITYSKQSEVDDAMSHRPHMIDGKSVDPKRAVPRDQSQRTESIMSSKRLYVSGVREEHTEDMFKDHFNQYGSVLKVEIIQDKNTGKPRGFAFISFDDYDGVDKCVLIKSHVINNYRCDVKKALSKEEMAKSQQQERERADRGGRTRGPPVAGGPGSWGAAADRGSYGGAWGGPSSYGAPPAGGQWGAAGGSRGPHYGGYGYGSGYGSAPSGAGGPGSWGAGGQSGQSWNAPGSQSGWGGRGY